MRQDEETDEFGSDGACFDRATLPRLFGGRAGWSPMRVAWDTNVLIDFAQHVGLYVDAEVFTPPDGVDPDYADELVALHEFMQIWMMRDIRIYVTDAQRSDGRLTEDRRSLRDTQLDLIASALECTGHDRDARVLDETTRSGARLPAGLLRHVADAQIVGEALRLGCDVFLTRDGDDILKHREALALLGLCVVTPTEWLDEMAFSNQLGPTGCAHGFLMPDTHKWEHLDEVREAYEAAKRSSQP